MAYKAKPLGTRELKTFKAAYESDPVRLAMTNAFSMSPLNVLAFDAVKARGLLYKFSVDIKTLKATNQKSSGRCWLFAATNVLRELTAKQINVENFEFSQSYLAFWDKFERCNYYLETIIATAGSPLSDRELDYVIKTGVGDGGQWGMFVNLVKKYGVVPKDAMPETAQSSATSNLNSLINRYLRRATPILRAMVQSGASAAEVRAEKERMLSKIYSFLVSCYGPSPETFNFEYVDKDRVYHIDTDLTPATFTAKYVGDILDDYVSIINAPTADKPFGKRYTVKYLNNIVGADSVTYLNLDIDTFKAAIIAQLRDGEPVWFGCDSGKFSESTRKQWDEDSYNFELITGLEQDITKADMLDYHISQLTHAMVFTGVNIDPDGKPDRWKIENSWGSDGIYNGYHIGSDSWVERFVFQAVVHKKYVSEYAPALASKPVELRPWDPIGSLAD